jgi:hypothetical protein
VQESALRKGLRENLTRWLNIDEQRMSRQHTFYGRAVGLVHSFVRQQTRQGAGISSGRTPGDPRDRHALFFQRSGKNFSADGNRGYWLAAPTCSQGCIHG